MLNKSLMSVSGPKAEGWILIASTEKPPSYTLWDFIQTEMLMTSDNEVGFSWMYNINNMNDIQGAYFYYDSKEIPTESPLSVEVKLDFTITTASGNEIMGFEAPILHGQLVGENKIVEHRSEVLKKDFTPELKAFFTPNNLAFIRSKSLNDCMYRVRAFYRPLPSAP